MRAKWKEKAEKSSYFHETVNLDGVNEQRRQKDKREKKKTNNLSLVAFLFIGTKCRFRLKSTEAICCPLLERDRLKLQ